MTNGTKDIVSTFINQAWRIVSGPVTLLLIPLYLTSMEQGYWYTFTSLAALSVFADLGFGVIVLQFAAHEFSSLRFNSQNIISGNKENIQKLASLFRFVVKWDTMAVLCAFPLISMGGYLFLGAQNKSTEIEWQGIWGIYSILSAIVFFNNILLTFFEGCNSVAKLQTIRFKMACGASCAMMACLVFHLGITALLASACVTSFTGAFFLMTHFRPTIYQLWNESKLQRYNWWPEFSALMWRYALSWCSGYFLFNAYTPIAFYFYGAEAAGQVGLSMAMWTAGLGIASCWITAMVPRLNILIEYKCWDELDRLFQKCFTRTVMTMIVGGGIFLLGYAVIGEYFPIFQRILSLRGMTILFFCWLGQLVINDWAIYLRAHKKEPFVRFSIVSAIGTFTATIFCIKYLAFDYLFAGFLCVTSVGIPFVWRIYNNQRKAHFLENK